MSIYDTAYSNSLDIRTRSSKTDSLLVLNPLTQQYDRITPGGEGHAASLPYYIGNDSIQFGNSRDLNGLFVNQVDGILNVTLPAHEASLEELDTRLNTVEDSILPAHEASLDELDARVDSNTTAVDNLMPRMTAAEGINTAQDVNITALHVKTANITQQGTSMLNLGYTSTISNRAAVTNSGLVVYNGTAATTSFPQVKVSPTYIHFFKALNTSVFLDYDRVDNVAKLASVSTIDFNDRINFTKGITLPGAVETSTTNKKMVVLDATSKALSYASIPSGGGNATAKVLEHTPSLGSTLFKHSNYNSPTASSASFVGGINTVRKYDMDGVSSAVFDLQEAGVAFDVAANSPHTHVLTFFAGDADYNAGNGAIPSEKLNLSISYAPSKDDLNSHLISVSLKPFPVSNSTNQWAMSRMIIVERKESGVGSKPEVELRGKFFITNHVLTGYFGEMNYGWTA